MEVGGGRNRTKIQSLKKKTTRLYATLNMNRIRYFMSSQLQECKCSGRMFLPARSAGWSTGAQMQKHTVDGDRRLKRIA